MIHGAAPQPATPRRRRCSAASRLTETAMRVFGTLALDSRDAVSSAKLLVQKIIGPLDAGSTATGHPQPLSRIRRRKCRAKPRRRPPVSLGAGLGLSGDRDASSTSGSGQELRRSSRACCSCVCRLHSNRTKATEVESAKSRVLGLEPICEADGDRRVSEAALHEHEGLMLRTLDPLSRSGRWQPRHSLRNRAECLES